jgi:hypothetical protein
MVSVHYQKGFQSCTTIYLFLHMEWAIMRLIKSRRIRPNWALILDWKCNSSIENSLPQHLKFLSSCRMQPKPPSLNKCEFTACQEMKALIRSVHSCRGIRSLAVMQIKDVPQGALFKAFACSQLA